MVCRPLALEEIEQFVIRDRGRTNLGVPPVERCVLLMSGAWGLGPVAEAAEALGDAGMHVLAVAGRNAACGNRGKKQALQIGDETCDPKQAR